MRPYIISICYTVLLAVFCACDDDSEQLTQQDILRHQLLNNTWQIEFVSNEVHKTTCKENYLLGFLPDQSILLSNGSSDRGSWNMRMIDPIVFYDELGPLPEDESNILIWDDSDDLQLELILQLNKGSAGDINGKWRVTGYNQDTIYLKNYNFSLLLIRVKEKSAA